MLFYVRLLMYRERMCISRPTTFIHWLVMKRNRFWYNCISCLFRFGHLSPTAGQSCTKQHSRNRNRWEREEATRRANEKKTITHETRASKCIIKWSFKNDRNGWTQKSNNLNHPRWINEQMISSTLVLGQLFSLCLIWAFAHNYLNNHLEKRFIRVKL